MGIPQPVAPSRPPRGTRGFDIRDFGAVPGGANAVITRKAIQAAVDASSEFDIVHSVFIPSGDWFVDRPVMVDRYTWLCGETGGLARIYGYFETTPVMLGLGRQGFSHSQALPPRNLDGGSGTAFHGLYLDADNWTDIAVGTPNTTITSAAKPFTAAHVGLALYVFPGGTLTGGASSNSPKQYEIVSVSGGVATLNGSPGATGTTGGTATTGAEHGYLWATPFSHGAYPATNGGLIDAYTITDQVTIEWQQDLGTTPLLSGPVMGMSTTAGNGRPAPWWIYFSTTAGGNNPGTATSIYLKYQIQDGSKYGVSKQAGFTLPSLPTGKVDFCVTISPRQGTVVAWAGSGGSNVQLAPVSAWTTTATAGSKFQPNMGVPFQLGSDTERVSGGATAGNTGQAPAGTPYTGMNRNFTGLRFWGAAPYVLTNATNSAQARVDTTAIDPGGTYGARYKHQEAGVLAWLPLDDAVADVIGTRMFTVCYGNGSTYSRSVAGYIAPSIGLGQDWTIGGMRDLTLTTIGGVYGGGLGVAYLGDYEIRDCTIEGGMYGLGNLPVGSDYTLTLAGLNTIGGSDVGIYIFDMDVQQVGLLRLAGYGRAAIYATTLASMRFDYLGIMGEPPHTQAPYLIYFTQGSVIKAGIILIDVEEQRPDIAAFLRVDAGANTPSSVICEIGTMAMSYMADQTAMVYLDTSDYDAYIGRVSIDNFQTYAGNAFRAVVEVGGGNGRCAHGVIESQQDIAAPLIRNSTPDGRSGLIGVQRPDVLYRSGLYALDSSILRPKHPVDGQFTEFRCLRAGGYHQGSPGLPMQWVGTGVIDLAGTSLATYVQANFGWTAAGNAVPAPGFNSDYSACQFLNSYFGLGITTTSSNATTALAAGVSAPTTSVKAALVTGTQTGYIGFSNNFEVTNAGYAEQTATFGASSGGVIGNNAAITFPAMTGTIPVVKTIVFLDQLNHTLGAAPLDPFTPTVGTAITYAIGKFTLQPVPVPAGMPLVQMGYVGTTILDMYNNWLLRGTAITPGAGLQFALSTAAASVSAPTEPAGGGYARVNAGAWQQSGLAITSAGQQPGVTWNTGAVAFPTPTGSWGTIRSIYLMDGSNNVIAAGNLTVPRTPAAGSAPLTVPAGGFWLSW